MTSDRVIARIETPQNDTQMRISCWRKLVDTVNDGTRRGPCHLPITMGMPLRKEPDEMMSLQRSTDIPQQAKTFQYGQVSCHKLIAGESNQRQKVASERLTMLVSLRRQTATSREGRDSSTSRIARSPCDDTICGCISGVSVTRSSLWIGRTGVSHSAI
jgi:hypothetical protein